MQDNAGTHLRSGLQRSFSKLLPTSGVLFVSIFDEEERIEESCWSIEQSIKSHDAPVPYSTMQHSEQKCVHFYSEWCIARYGAGALLDLWIWSIALTDLLYYTVIRFSHNICLSCAHHGHQSKGKRNSGWLLGLWWKYWNKPWMLIIEDVI